MATYITGRSAWAAGGIFDVHKIISHSIDGRLLAEIKSARRAQRDRFPAIVGLAEFDSGHAVIEELPAVTASLCTSDPNKRVFVDTASAEMQRDGVSCGDFVDVPSLDASERHRVIGFQNPIILD